MGNIPEILKNNGFKKNSNLLLNSKNIIKYFSKTFKIA